MEKNNYSRRQFVKAGSTISAGTLLASPHITNAQNSSKTIKVGLVGIGGRGSGAAAQAMAADENVALTAIGDMFEDRIKLAQSNILKARGRDKYQVTPETTFSGFDAYKKVIDSGVDVVILTSPPNFRPQHLEYAVEKGVHCFFEKPVAVDAPGVRKVIELAKKAKEKNLGFMSGFCWRHHKPKQEVFGRILDGGLGDIHAMYSTYNGGEVWKKTREEGWSDLEAQLRNWNAHLWLSGDSIVEQAVHCIDMMQWAMGEQLPLCSKALVVDKSMTTLINMETSTTILPVFSNGKTVPKDIIFLGSKMVQLAVMRLNYSEPKELALPKIDILSLQAIIHGVTAGKIMTCISRNMMNCSHPFVQVSLSMTEKKQHIARWLPYWEEWLPTQAKK